MIVCFVLRFFMRIYLSPIQVAGDMASDLSTTYLYLNHVNDELRIIGYYSVGILLFQRVTA